MHTANIGANISTMIAAEAGYHCEVDTVDEARWYEILEQFDDGNIYQTWAYDEVRCGRKNISHLVLRKDGEVMAAAQARIVKFPFLKIGIAYVRWGPLWRRKGKIPDPEVFRHAIRALRTEYAFRRGLVLRVYPAVFQNDSSSHLSSILSEEEYTLQPQERPDRTIILNLSRPLEDLRQGLRSHWRRNLKTAEKSELEIVESSDVGSFEQFVPIYKEMVGRKKFLEPNDIGEFAKIQERLPGRFKMKIMLCKSKGEICAGLISSAIGESAIYLFGATSDAGLKRRGSYLLHWRLIEELIKSGLKAYDLHGIDSIRNPGTYRFKADLCGDNGSEECFLGKYQSPGNRVSNWCVGLGEGMMMNWRRFRRNLAERGASRASEETRNPVTAPCE